MAASARAAGRPLGGRAGWAAFFGLSVLLLWQGFAKDRWNVADPRWFGTFQQDTESMVIGRLVQSRQAGAFSYGGLLGWVITNADPTASGVGVQYDAYRAGGVFDSFEPYSSQPGAQALIFAALDGTLRQPPEARLELYRSLTAFGTAVALSLVILWFGLELGPAVAVAVLLSALASEWLTVFGRNLFWSLWAFYGPLAVSMFWLRRQAARPEPKPTAFGGVLFLAVAAKGLLTGFEYMTTLVVMVLVPVVYYAVRDRWGWRRALGWLAAGVAGCALGALAVAAILTVQIGSVRGGLQAGVDHIIYVFAKRTYGDPAAFPEAYRWSLQAPLGDVLLAYLRGRFFDANRFVRSASLFVTVYVLKVRYLYLLVIFAIASLAAWLAGRRDPGRADARRGLLAATWFSLAAPLSWFVLFKAHSEIHTHMNFIVWQMPFTLFGFAVVGFVFGDLLARLRRRLSAARAPISSAAPPPAKD